MKDVTSIIKNPMYAAGIAAVITIIAKWFDNRLSYTKGSLLGYIKSALFSAALVGGWVYILKNPAQTKETTRQFMSSVSPNGFSSL